MKYMGNKQRIANEIINSILNFAKPTDCFVDLFCGSCSVIERVSPMFFPIRIANDKNVFLMAMLKSLQNGIKFPEIITKERYSEMRTKYNLNKKGLISLDAKEIAEIGWYGWMGSFNGRFFDGGYSGHNVNGRDYISEQIRNTLRQIPKLKDIMFESMSYEQFARFIPKGSVVYCDIPYRGTKQYDTSKDFDHDKFYDWCREHKNDFQIFVSEYSMPNDFECIWQKEVTNAMNTDKTYKPIEKLFRI